MFAFREMRISDLDELLVLQEAGSVLALQQVFPQERYPFPSDTLRTRWTDEIADADTGTHVAVDELDRLVGFAATRGNELLHFGTAVETWGTGLATAFHDRTVEELLRRLPQPPTHLWLRVFDENARARRFYEKLGWQDTGITTRTAFPPHPLLIEYRRPA